MRSVPAMGSPGQCNAGEGYQAGSLGAADAEEADSEGRELQRCRGYLAACGRKAAAKLAADQAAADGRCGSAAAASADAPRAAGRPPRRPRAARLQPVGSVAVEVQERALRRHLVQAAHMLARKGMPPSGGQQPFARGRRSRREAAAGASRRRPAGATWARHSG